MSEDMDEHYPDCPISAGSDDPDANPVCNCEEVTRQIRADFAAARYELERGK